MKLSKAPRLFAAVLFRLSKNALELFEKKIADCARNFCKCRRENCLPDVDVKREKIGIFWQGEILHKGKKI